MFMSSFWRYEPEEESLPFALCITSRIGLSTHSDHMKPGLERWVIMHVDHLKPGCLLELRCS